MYPGAYPQPEPIVFEQAATNWLVLDVTPNVGTISTGDLVESPYIVGAPAPADRLVERKREDVVFGPFADLSAARIFR